MEVCWTLIKCLCLLFHRLDLGLFQLLTSLLWTCYVFISLKCLQCGWTLPQVGVSVWRRPLTATHPGTSAELANHAQSEAPTSDPYDNGLVSGGHLLPPLLVFRQAVWGTHRALTPEDPQWGGGGRTMLPVHQRSMRLSIKVRPPLLHSECHPEAEIQKQCVM